MKAYIKSKKYELKSIPEKYPSHHLVIRKAQQILISSFQKLKKEIDVDNFNITENLNDKKRDNLWMTRFGFISRDWLRLDLVQSQYNQFKESMKQKFEVERSPTNIRRYIKEELRFNYKKGSSRPIAWKSQEHIYPQSIFSWSVLREIQDEALLSTLMKEAKIDLSKGTTHFFH